MCATVREPHWLAVVLLVAVGIANSLSEVIGAPSLRTFALATVASPLPRAFSQSASLSGFAHELNIEVTTADGAVVRRTESSELYASLPGPYERRVIYGSGLSFGPAVPGRIFSSILRYGFCNSGPLAQRMGLTAPLKAAAVVGDAPRGRRGGAPRVVVKCDNANTP